MNSALNYREKHQNHLFKKEIRFFHSFAKIVSLFFYIACLTIAILVASHLLYNNTTTTKYTTNTIIINNNNNQKTDQHHIEACDLFKGQWVQDYSRGPLYTNHSCTTIPFLRNCFLHGRKDTDFLHWRWKPDQCELPRFRPENFLAGLRGKTMAFIGDSLARNQMESLLCLLSTVETPKAVEQDSKAVDKEMKDKFGTWEFTKHNFTLMALWSQFLVTATERLVNGTSTGGFNLHLDKVDTNWSEKLPSIDFAVFSDAHWFFRSNYLYQGSNLIGCVYCQSPNVKYIRPGWAIRKAFQAAFKAINNCTNCRKIFTVLRTFSPSQFENGTWNNGGSCNRTRPIGREEVDEGWSDWEYRKIQVEESEIAKKEGEESGNKFEVLDITEMMVMRPDAHPGVHWGNKWMKGYSDCIHWCLPGPIDVWNELLFGLMKRQGVLSSETGEGL